MTPHKFQQFAKSTQFYPLLGKEKQALPMLLFDGSENNTVLFDMDLTDAAAFEEYINEGLQRHAAHCAVGGYLEKRILYTSYPEFSENKRTIHLGLDIFTAAGEAIFAPYAGKIHSFANNKGAGNYGPTIILEHATEAGIFYSLYGHLSIESIENLTIGQKFTAGEQLCALGDAKVNGNWSPHLHFQLILDLQGHSGDYVGVCTEKELNFYRNNCPDPNLLCQFSILR